MSTKPPAEPRSFDLPDQESMIEESPATIHPQAIDLEDVTLSDEITDTFEPEISTSQSKASSFSWTNLFIGALASLLTLAAGLWVDGLITDLFARHTALGYAGLAIMAVLVAAGLFICVNEIMALMRIRKADHYRDLANAAHYQDDDQLALDLQEKLCRHYSGQLNTTSARQTLSTHRNDIMGGTDRIRFIEETLMTPLDREAHKVISGASQRVAIVTAVSPRALIDIIYVLGENIRLIRKVAEIYGGRPGLFATLGLFRRILTHLAVTGVLSAGDGLAEQVIGQGLASRISTRFGEGVVNGLLTARIGLAAHDICRPVPFLASPRPNVATYFNSLTGLNGSNRYE